MGSNGIERLVGNERYSKMQGMKVLLVGAGGIGCELLKNLILMGFGEIHVVDLDTIDMSNLNRQFLFRQRDIRKAKATTAVRAVEYFSNSKLVAHQGNIMDSEVFPLSWFKQFNILFNALDNLSARRYVNKMSQFLNVPLLESGTAGFDGHIQPIIPGKTECFDCTAKETPKTFPICTIRSTPSQLVHCVVWAKNFLFQQLFGGGEQEMPSQEDMGTNDPSEIERINQETDELYQLHEWVQYGDETKVYDIIKKLFVHDIEKLLMIENLWRTRRKPVPLGNVQPYSEDINNDHHAMWSLQDNINKFAQSTKILMKRLKSEKSLEFDKDDQDMLEFVASAANTRAHIFNIQMKTVFDIKQIAGNIIPAIVTTNAIIAGLSSLVSLRVLNLLDIISNGPTNIPMAFTAKASNMSSHRYLVAPLLAPPNPKCPVCSHYQRTVITLNQESWQSMKLGDLIKKIRDRYGFSEEMSVMDMTSNRLLADFDFDDLYSQTLQGLRLNIGTILAVSDSISKEDDTVRKPIEFYLELDNLVNEIDFPALPLVRVIQEDETENPEEPKVDDGEPIFVDNGAILIEDEETRAEVDKQRKRAYSNVENASITKRPKVDEADAAIILLD
ncbi:E1 ubiquitin-activating protein UBA2 Ecym_2314 [Eremothecium cymbalariae DBVPG|uniref:Ubiquitin-activating enzyme E1-like n=2 Tax=Eremothecium cymbalariae TaxID=45285 RepID=G8JQ54_ERECY|nr:Hypothetical protein Ecym_2314 [Eremothecium cymbalariae DBVPG\